MNKDVVVVYHDPCLDGMASRYAAWKKFGNDASYIPGKYEGKFTMDRFKDKRVYCVDFSYKKDAILQIMAVCKSLNIYDHHKTAVPEVRAAQAELEGTESYNRLHYTYDADHSGVGVVWTAFFPGQPMPRVLWHIQDRDLWRFDLPHTKEVCCYMGSLNFDFKKWVYAIEKACPKAILARGITIRSKELRDIADITSKAKSTKLDGYDIDLLTNCPANYVSEACNELLKDANIDFAANRSQTDEGWSWSLRSTDDRVDVGALAKGKGGGGHRNAAGFFVADV